MAWQFFYHLPPFINQNQGLAE